jgi:hypothetical protein
MSELPSGVTIAPPPPELQLDDDHDYRFEHWASDRRRSGLSAIQRATAFPQPIEVDAPELLRVKPFACSGSMDSTRYREANKFRTMPEMGWEEARIALNRLLQPVRYGSGKPDQQHVALAEFALTAAGFTGFVGKRGEHAVKLRDALGDAIDKLRGHLDGILLEAARQADLLARPMTLHGDMGGGPEFVANSIVGAFWTMVPTTADKWVQIIEATPDQAMTALDYLRATLATWDERSPLSAVVLSRLAGNNRPTAAEYAEAIHIADMLVFTGEKLLALYAGIMHTMPIYRMYPATPEHDAIRLWWAWGRPARLIDGRPPRPPKPRKQVLDPSIITATRPQDVVREVMQKTGINRTTAQRMTAAMRAKMRWNRQHMAETLLRKGLTKAEVARKVGLSPSRISAMFKGKQFANRELDALAFLRQPSG